MFKWEKGRQGTGYEKLKIFQFLNMDCYILQYKVGDHIPWHTDPVEGRKHYRCNILLKSSLGGTLFIQPKGDLPTPKRGLITIFRSDIVPHMVTKVIKGSRLVLTFGIAI